MKSTGNFLKLGGSVAGLVVALLIAVSVNVILSNVNLRKDLTEEKLFTLSEGTRQIIGSLEQPVTLKFFFNESDPKVPMGLKGFASGVQDLLSEYAIRSNGKVIVETYDPKPDSDAADWAQRYGVAGQSMGFMGPELYIGLVAVMGDAQAVLPVLDPQAENLLEYNITRMISRLASPKKPVLGVMSSLPVLGARSPASPYPMPGTPPPKPAWFAFTDLKQDYEVRELDTAAEAIDDDIDALLLIHPKEWSDETLFAIDQFLLRGGRLMVFLDPFSLAEAESQADSPMGFSPKSSDLKKLLAAWGVSYDSSKVVADLEAMSRLRVGPGNEIQESPVWLSLRKAHLNAEDILTSRLEFVMMPYAGSFDVSDTTGLQATTLIASSQTSASVDAMTAQYSIDGVRRGFASGFKALPLAVRLHGTFQTAFPEGKPSAAPDDAADTGEAEDKAAEAEAAPAEAFLTESTEPGTVILVGDVDMLSDNYCVRAMNFMGFQAHQPINDNLALLQNTLEQIAGSTALVGIRVRGKTDRPFEVVLALERKAQERYLAEETRLQQTLETAQRRLDELQREKDSSQKFILSPKQKQEIDNFQEQVSKTKQELKLVRRKLREDIDSLGAKIKAINILLMPALVAAIGVAFGIYRKRSQA